MSWFTYCGPPGTSSWFWTADPSSTSLWRTFASLGTSTGTPCCAAGPRARWWLWSGSSRTRRSWAGCGAGTSPSWWWWTRGARRRRSSSRKAWPRCCSRLCSTRSRRTSASCEVDLRAFRRPTQSSATPLPAAACLRWSQNQQRWVEQHPHTIGTVRWSCSPSCSWAAPFTRAAGRAWRRRASRPCSTSPPPVPTCTRASCSTCGSRWRTAWGPTSGPASPRPSPSSTRCSRAAGACWCTARRASRARPPSAWPTSCTRGASGWTRPSASSSRGATSSRPTWPSWGSCCSTRWTSCARADGRTDGAGRAETAGGADVGGWAGFRGLRALRWTWFPTHQPAAADGNPPDTFHVVTLRFWTGSGAGPSGTASAGASR